VDVADTNANGFYEMEIRGKMINPKMKSFDEILIFILFYKKMIITTNEIILLPSGSTFHVHESTAIHSFLMRNYGTSRSLFFPFPHLQFFAILHI
jgi:hypothetical protein